MKNSKKTKASISKASSFIDVPLEELLEAGCHFGHSASKINPNMKPYVYMTRNGVNIIDLVKTQKKLIIAARFLGDLVAQGGQVVLVGTKRQAVPVIKKRAKEAGLFYIKKRWIGGLLTNWEEVRKNLLRLAKIEKDLQQKNRRGRTKYEQVLLERDYQRLESVYGGIVNLKEIPQAFFIVDVKQEKTAVSEIKKMGVPIVAIVDTNGNPAGIDYMIPANDDARGSIDYILSKIVEAIKNKKPLHKVKKINHEKK